MTDVSLALALSKTVHDLCNAHGDVPHDIGLTLEAVVRDHVAKNPRSFFEAVSLDQLAAEQCVKPIKSIDDLACPDLADPKLWEGLEDRNGDHGQTPPDRHGDQRMTDEYHESESVRRDRMIDMRIAEIASDLNLCRFQMRSNNNLCAAKLAERVRDAVETVRVECIEKVKAGEGGS